MEWKEATRLKSGTKWEPKKQVCGQFSPYGAFLLAGTYVH